MNRWWLLHLSLPKTLSNPKFEISKVYTISLQKYRRISKFEFVAKTQFHNVNNLFIKSYDPQIVFCDKLQLIFNKTKCDLISEKFPKNIAILFTDLISEKSPKNIAILFTLSWTSLTFSPYSLFCPIMFCTSPIKDSSCPSEETNRKIKVISFRIQKYYLFSGFLG